MADVTPFVPKPGTATPPGVTDTGATGSNAAQFAMADHTHASKARKQILSVPATGLITWTFPTAFGSGVVPVCNAMPIVPSGTTALVNAQQEGDATNTQVTFRITVYQQTLASALGLTILSLNNSALPANTKISLIALEP